MNKYKYIIILMGIIGFASSCNDDFLERTPIVNISDANYWKAPNDLKMYVNNFYNQNDLLPRYDGYGNTGIYSIDAENGSDAYIYIDYNTRMNGEKTLPASGEGWAIKDWAMLRDINYFMDNYKVVDAPWDNVKLYVGEALFFRSLFYFEKLRKFGDLPWASTTIATDSKVLFEKRLPRNQVADSILHDLDLAVSYLPERKSWTGRVTKEIALALQARIALYEGTWERYHAGKNTDFKVAASDGTTYIQKAAEASAALMTLAEANGFPALDNTGIENGYQLLFNQKDYSASKEVLFWRKYAVGEGLYTRWVRYTGSGAGKGLTKSMVESYLCTDGKPISGNPLYLGDANLQTVVTNRDPRLNQTIYVDDEKHIMWYKAAGNEMFLYPSFEDANENKSVTGYQLFKGHSGDYQEYENSQGTTGCIYFRYAETLLIYAEAKAELGTITQADIDKTVNALRMRVGMNNGLLDIGNITTDPNWDFAGITPLLNEIRRERKIELACEGFRVDDIFRWAAADEIIAGLKPKGAPKAQWDNYPGATSAFLEAWAELTVDANGYIDPYQSYNAMSAGYKFNLQRDYLLPIPSNELTLNPNLGQNPGW